ncbi:hypothetical protein VSK92_05860 [Bacillus swezeyi]
MLHEYHFKGLVSQEDIELCLKSFDEISVYPLGTEWTFTKYFFPGQYEKGFRLSAFSKELYNAFVEIIRDHNSRTKIEIPMFYFTGTVENALRFLGTDGVNVSRISINDWRSCIEESGYIAAEKYSEFLLAEGER